MTKMTKETLRRGTEQREAQEAQWMELQQLKAQNAELLAFLLETVEEHNNNASRDATDAGMEFTNIPCDCPWCLKAKRFLP